MNRTNILNIRTPEGVSFPLHLAGPATRCLAWSIDFACILLLQNLIGYALILPGIVSPELSQALSIVLYFTLSISYGIFLEWLWNGKTVGKRICKLRVIDSEGLKLTLPQLVIRNLMRAVDIFPCFYLMGGISCLVTKRYQRLGDLAAQTVVIRTIKIGKPDISTILPDKYNSFKDYPFIASRLQNNTSPELAGLMLKALIRRNTLEIDARKEIYIELVEQLNSCAKFPQEATDGLSDERYLRNCVEILFS